MIVTKNPLPCFKLILVFMACLAELSGLFGAQLMASEQQKASRELVERVYLDWDHSGKMSTFTVFRESDANGEATDRLIVSLDGAKTWELVSHEGEWAPISEAGLSNLRRQNLAPNSKHFLFVSSGAANARVYLILKGMDSGCCVGSLTVLTPDAHGQPRVVFQSSSHLLAAIVPTESGDTLQLIGQSSDSEARATKNAQSYDPYRVYLLEEDRPAKYDLSLSKAYTLAHYCQWHGPEYDEKFVAVGSTTGSTHCRVMAESAFYLYRQKHPERFPEP